MEEKKENNSNLFSMMNANSSLFLMKNVNPSDTEYNESAVKADSVSFYAEYRRDTEITSDLYGGDAYPMVWSTEVQGKKVGLILVSDGMGSGSFRHNGLYEKYYTGENTTTEEEGKKLYDFLSNLYGEKFFEDKQAVDYAIRSFSPCPPDSMYMTPSGKSCFAGPFYCRSSQYLASRILCVGVFYKFRKKFAEIFSEQGAWNKDLLDEFRREIEKYVDGETDENGEICYNGKVVTFDNYKEWVNDEKAPECLRKSIWKSFDIAKDPEVAKCIYLPCTFASWWFVENEKDIDAAALYLGDSRCYKVDLKDGVKQISVDDALEGDGAMTVTQSFGFSHNIKDVVHNGKRIKTHDGSIKVTMIKADKPCALFCCSDGVYDTCPVYDEKIKGMQQREPADYLKGFEYFREVNDLAFEYNFLTILRKCNSLDDVRNMIARSFYSHAVPGGVDARGARSAVSTFKSGEESGGVKLDDSATFGIQFFSNKKGFPEIITKLRDNNNTVLDRIWKLFTGADTKGNYCTRMENMGEPETRKKDSIDKAIMDNKGGKEFIELLKTNAINNFSIIGEAQKMYGQDYTGKKKPVAISSVLCNHFKELGLNATEEYNDVFNVNFEVDGENDDIELTEGLIEKLRSMKESFRDIESKYNSAKQAEDVKRIVEEKEYSITENICSLKKVETYSKEKALENLKQIKYCVQEIGAVVENDNTQQKAMELDELFAEAKEYKFKFLCEQIEYLKNNNKLSPLAEAWLNDTNALFINAAEKQSVLFEKPTISKEIIIDDNTMIALSELVPDDKKEDGFGIYFSRLVEVDSEEREEIYRNLPDYEELENYKKAKEAVENYNGLFADNVEEVKSSDIGDYHNVTLDKGRVDPE